MDSKIFGEKLRRLRLARGFASQYALAAALGTTRAAVNAWEAGRYVPGQAMLEKICRVLGCPPEFLTQETGQEEVLDGRSPAAEPAGEELANCGTSRDVHATLGSRIAHARKFRGLTQAELAGKLGVDQRTIAYWEANDRRPDPDTLRRLALVLDVSADYLLGLAHERANRLPSAVELGAVLGWWSPEEVARIRGIGNWQERLENAYEEERQVAMAGGDGPVGSADAFDLLIRACQKTGISYTLAFPCRRLVEKIRAWQKKNGWSDYEMMRRLGHVKGCEENWAAAYVRNQDWVTLLEDPKRMMVNEHTNGMFERFAELMGIPLRELLDDNVPPPEDLVER